MKPGQKLAFLGGGNMAEAMIKGLLRARTATPEQITVSVRRADREEELRRLYKVEVSRNNPALAAAAEVVILSVKPQVMGEMLDLVAPSIGPNHLVISVAAGVPIAAIERKLGPTARVIRAMPNTPALVGQGACAVSAGSHSTEADMEIAKSIFDSVGMTVVVEEYLLDAVTGLSGSGPAYIFLIIEALSDAGVKVGLPRRTAQALAAQTVAGSARLLIETGIHPGQLKDQVTSPGGTAIAGLHTLEAGGLRTTLINAVEVATQRAKELGKDLTRKMEG
jgi:pyrroline-5-carboxylate reductase